MAAAVASAVPGPPMYGQSRRYRRFVWLAMLTRLGSLACALWMVPLGWFPRVGMRVYRCDACGQWPAGGWILDSRRPLRANFFLPELRTGRFRCEHCGTQFRLREC